MSNEVVAGRVWRQRQVLKDGFAPLECAVFLIGLPASTPACLTLFDLLPPVFSTWLECFCSNVSQITACLAQNSPTTSILLKIKTKVLMEAYVALGDLPLLSHSHLKNTGKKG